MSWIWPIHRTQETIRLGWLALCLIAHPSRGLLCDCKTVNLREGSFEAPSTIPHLHTLSSYSEWEDWWILFVILRSKVCTPTIWINMATTSHHASPLSKLQNREYLSSHSQCHTFSAPVILPSIQFLVTGCFNKYFRRICLINIFCPPSIKLLFYECIKLIKLN